MGKSSVMMVLNALHSGGTEATCVELARNLVREHTVEVVSLHGGGPAAEELKAAGVGTHLLSTNGVPRPVAASLALQRLLRNMRPDAVLTFLYVSDLFGGALARACVPAARVFWNIRNNVLSKRHTGRLSYFACRANARLSRLIPHQIVYCSHLAREQHESIGYYRGVGTVVENSADSVSFAFSEKKRQELRAGMPGDEYIFLFMGRFDEVKRVDLYLLAGAALCRRHRRVRFVIAGRDMDHANPRLRTAIVTSGIPVDRLELLGHVSDPQLLYSAADCLVVTSETEGSPNVVYEALATRLPTIIMATVGTEHICGPGITRLPQRDLAALVDAMESVVAGGPVPPAARLSREQSQRQLLPHPLVVHYRRVLTGS